MALTKNGGGLEVDVTAVGPDVPWGRISPCCGTNEKGDNGGLDGFLSMPQEMVFAKCPGVNCGWVTPVGMVADAADIPGIARALGANSTRCTNCGTVIPWNGRLHPRSQVQEEINRQPQPVYVICDKCGVGTPSGVSCPTSALLDPSNTFRNNRTQCGGCGHMVLWSKAELIPLDVLQERMLLKRPDQR